MLERIKIVPDSHEHWLNLRSNDVTSTEISALFGLSPYSTNFELWHNKKANTVVKLEPNERMSWGNALEEAIANEAARVNGWDIKPRKDYYRIESLKLGASYDFEAIINEKKTLIEVKNVDGLVFKDKWKVAEDGSIEAPYHIEMQVQQQLLVADYDQAIIVALVGGNKLHTLYRDPNPEIQEAMVEKVSAFWSTIESNEAPAPNFEADSDFIMKMFKYIPPLKLIETSAHDYMIKKYQDIAKEIKNLEVLKKATKAEIFTIVGDYEKLKSDSYTVSMGLTTRGTAQFRNFKVYERKK